MNRGEVWLAEVGCKRRPVLVLTRSEILDVRESVTVAEITTSVRGPAVEVPVPSDVKLKNPDSVINCDGPNTVRQRTLTTFVGNVGDETMHAVCRAVATPSIDSTGSGSSPGVARGLLPLHTEAVWSGR